MTGSPGRLASILAVQGLENPSSNEFVRNPDFRQIATFFLGSVFLYSLHHIAYSPFVRNFLHLVFRRPSPARARHAYDVEANLPSGLREKDLKATWIGTRRDSESSAEPAYEQVGHGSEDFTTLAFTLTLCFAFASIASFGSLLTFSPVAGDSACAFLVAWGGMADRLARLVGMLMLFLEIRRFGIARYETVLCWVLLTIGLIFVFVVNAISVGTIRPVATLHIALCYRKHFLPTSIVSSLVQLSLQAYILVRLLTLIPVEAGRTQFARWTDVRFIRILSLIVLELLTVVPDAIPTTVVGDFVPFSLGSLAVLCAFNHRHRHASPLSPVALPAPEMEVQTRSRPSTYLRPSASAHRVSLPRSTPYIPNHPFASVDLSREHVREDSQEGPHTAMSVWTMASDAVSIDNAMIGVASRYSRPPTKNSPTPRHAIPEPHPEATRKSTAAEVIVASWQQPKVERPPPAMQQRQPSRHRRDASRKIILDQVQFAERLEHEEANDDPGPVTGPVARPARPRVATEMLLSPPGAQLASALSTNTAHTTASAVLGSDIVRTTSKKDRTKRSPSSKPSPTARSRASLTPSTVESYTTMISPSNSRSTRRYSLSSTLHFGTRDDLATVREGGQESEGSTPTRTPTTGESAMSWAGYGPSLSAMMARAGPMPAVRGIPPQPRLRPTTNARGPRVPPVAARKEGGHDPSPLVRTPINASLPSTPNPPASRKASAVSVDSSIAT